MLNRRQQLILVWPFPIGEFLGKQGRLSVLGYFAIESGVTVATGFERV